MLNWKTTWYALAGMTLATALLGCTEPPVDPLRTTSRLLHEIEIQPRFLFGLDCEAAAERRPSLGCSQLHQLLNDVRPFPEDRQTVRVSVTTPSGMVGKPLIVRTKIVASRGKSRESAGTVFYPKAPAAFDLDFDLEGVTPDKRRQLRLLAQAYRIPAKELQWITKKIQIPEEAIFSTGIALEKIDTGMDPAGASFVVRVVDEEGLNETLYEGSLSSEEKPGWKDISTDLGHLAGKQVRFIFETRVADAEIAFPLFGAPRVLARSPRGRARNIILVSLDTLRGDHVEKTVAGTALMPRLDAWSSGGTVFTQAFSSYPSTSAGHMTLFTSTWPAEHRVTFASEIAPRWVSMLTETFAENGYTTGAITENAMLAAHSGFARGFDTYKENRGVANWDSAGEAEATIRDGVRWLENHKDDVFYLFLHTYEVHAPYAPPEDLRLPVSPGATRAEKELRRYQGETRHMDRILAGLFRALEELNLEEDTIVVITSDHGEAFGEHGHIGHSRSVYDEYVHVPLIFRGPGIIQAGQRFDRQISLVDIAPTLLGLTELPTPPTMRGQSLAAALQGEQLAASDGFIFLEAPIGFARKKGRVFAARSEKYKFIGRENLVEVEEIYDLESDPGEQANLAGDSELQKMAQAVIRQYKNIDRQSRARVAGGTLPPVPAKETLNSDMQEKLKALGYVD